LCSIVNAGITVVTLSPSEMQYHRGRDITPLVLAVVEFGRGHSESAVKGERVSAAWDEKKRLVREWRKKKQLAEQGRGPDPGHPPILTRRTPAWIGERGGKMFLIADNARIVQRIFNLCIEGRGLSLIVDRLTREGVEPFDDATNGWSKAYVGKILRGKVVLGEYQPIKLGEPDGPPIPGYYPAVIDEATWHQAQAAMAARKDHPGRSITTEKTAALFTGLVYDAEQRMWPKEETTRITDKKSGAVQSPQHCKMLIAWQTRGIKGKRRQKQVLVSARSMEGAAPSVSFPNEVFEEAILALLQEIKPADILGEQPESESVALATELAATEHQIHQLETELVGGGNVPSLASAMKKLDTVRRDVQARLAAAQQRESTPAAVAWTDAKSLFAIAKNEKHRLRLRGLLRQIIDKIWILVVPRASHRLAAVQINFAGGARRDYLIHYKAAGRGRKGSWEARSITFAAGDTRAARALELSNKKDARDLQKVLEKADLENVFGDA